MAEDRGSKRRRKQDPQRHGARPRLEKTIEGVSDELILAMAEKIGDNPKLPKLALKLGLRDEGAEIFIKMNRMNGIVSSEGTRRMLYAWRENTTGDKQLATLKAALIDADLAGIPDKFPSMVEEKARKVPSFPMDNRSEPICGDGDEEAHVFRSSISDLDIKRLKRFGFDLINEVLERRYTDPARFAEDIVLRNQGFLPELKRRDSSSRSFYEMENSRHDIFKSPTRRLTVSGSNTAELTSLCRSLAYDWAKQNRASALSDMEHLFELSADDIKPNQTIENAIKDQLFPDLDEVDEALIRQLLKDRPDGITILLDGFNGKNCGDNIMDVLSGRTLPEVTVMVTTKPRYSTMLHRMTPGGYDRIDMH